MKCSFIRFLKFQFINKLKNVTFFSLFNIYLNVAITLKMVETLKLAIHFNAIAQRDTTLVSIMSSYFYDISKNENITFYIN